MALQGLDFDHDHVEGKFADFSSQHLADLAGNGFTGPAFLSVAASLLSLARWDRRDAADLDLNEEIKFLQASASASAGL